MKVVLLAGGLGTRISEETGIKPKPMVEIGGKPIIWHIMKTYSVYGFNEFVVLLGYKGYVIKGLENVKDAVIFHSGTIVEGDKVVTNGGRVLTLTGLGNSMQEALKKSYKGLKEIQFKEMYYRKDIGFDL